MEGLTFGTCGRSDLTGQDRTERQRVAVIDDMIIHTRCIYQHYSIRINDRIAIGILVMVITLHISALHLNAVRDDERIVQRVVVVVGHAMLG